MADEIKNVIVGTAGHIDHGKSALVEALTGTHPDRLEEERRRGITIDLGFAFLELGNVRLGFVDVPGHERFVRNMLAGAGGIDLVLLVVAADEGIKPQTREHFDICKLLGIPRGIVAITKSDLMDANATDLRRPELLNEVREFVRGSFLEGAPVLPVSARTGAGLAELKQALAQVAGNVPAKDVRRHFRLPIDRAFAMKGFGTVVTGTLVAGQAKVGEEVELQPAARRVRVRGLQSGGRAIERATAGQRTAVNLAGIDLAEVSRGMVLATPGRFSATRHLDARITLLGSARAMKNRARVHIHQGTAETIATVTLLEGAQLAPGSAGLAHLVFQDGIFLLPGDRFILRQFSPVVTIGGGTVLQTVKRRRAKDPAVLRLLPVLESGNKEAILQGLLEEGARGMTIDAIISRTAWISEETAAAAASLVKSGAAVVLHKEPMMIAAASYVKECAARMRASVAQFHSTNPLAAGIAKEELRARAAKDAAPEIFQAALEGSVSAGELAVAGDTVKRVGHAVKLAGDEDRARREIEAAFAKAGLAVPATAEVFAKLGIDSKRAHGVLQLLLREKVLVRLTEDLVFHAGALDGLKKTLAAHKRAHGARLSVPAFKELTGVSRKYAIPLLEYLDRNGVTRREGDERVII
ncbi:MAG TPA: selenocysteine-specific translation elongation factor [Candidatus Acidoferrales bacterium]|jgi:selenocysteine-specific elongation factor|nr:selenocysteine-specific translation elongation factor [Candidatus Acidoferrales bacterium]